MSLVIVATMFPKPEFRDEVISTLETVIDRVHSEDAGCELYSLNEGRDRLVMIEKWATPEDLQAHSVSPAFKALTAALEGKMAADMDVQVLQPHPAGSAGQGLL
ncbi:antibiotic biosynthesis monooxygenase [Arthrobacter sp. zg-ZUI100]|uniref:Antibiotic biosynthesis monooxygenase n=1 Tax=Arthrobacter jiangjiafuii TaxID=2817475 RepID=A0A975M2M7_9MICC|nr:antibiotic biosynthesis monooxygenase [Arthrobacter jiangjiafuii]MBP3036220.1 antibiotic biosynthesis monooxygenase [Arthrobacter jiangjiafuii]MBP3043277.1 antibiotic biosynthesis monooxygenase [Arthrobacter jiangjiafuii]QWC08821.1 antibiotic biosynthesis monooxygenase [Arthrobacter jiangjiafuii]